MVKRAIAMIIPPCTTATFLVNTAAVNCVIPVTKVDLESCFITTKVALHGCDMVEYCNIIQTC